MKIDRYHGFNSVLPAVHFCCPALLGLQMCIKVTGLHRRGLWTERSSSHGKDTMEWLQMILAVIWLDSSCPPGPHTCLWENTLLTESWRFLAQLLQRVFTSTQKGDGDNRRNPVAIHSLSSSYFPSRHTPPLSRRPDQSCGIFATRPRSARGGLEQGEQSAGLVSLLEMSNVHKVCQETCAMSLTRVWMSCRHRGHVSNCKAHSIHIPLKKNEGKK